MNEYFFLFISCFIAFFVKGITGFGNTLVLGSLFSFTISNKVTTPVDLLFSIPTNTYMVWKERKSISMKIVIPLSLMLLVGIIPGTLLLKVGNDWILKSAFGIVVMGIAIEIMTRKTLPESVKKSNGIFLLVIGLISGILAGLFGIGALLVAYISRTTNNRAAFRANICCVFLVENLFRLFLYWYTGILNKEVLLLAFGLSPAVILGMYFGIRIEAKMNEKVSKYSVIALLATSGLILFIKNAFFH